MANISFHLPDDFLKRLESLGNKYDGVIQVVLKEGAAPLYDTAKQSLMSVIGQKTKHKSESSGDMLNSLTSTKPYQMSDGSWNIKVGCAGVDRKGVSNAMKASVLEYGKSDQAAKPWLKPSISRARKLCIQRMQDTLEKEVDQL